MITQPQIRKKALVPWNSGAFLKSCIDGPPIFPFEIRFRTPNGREILEKYEAVRQWIRTLQHHSKETRPQGYDIVWRSIRHRTLGEQRMPQRIRFSTAEDWLFYIRKEAAHREFLDMAARTGATLPELLPYLAQHPLKALEHAARWPDILTVCRWFKNHPVPGKYIRQLDIPGVDTKFIENQKSVLMDLLPLVLEAAHYRSAVTGLAKHGFERKFGLKYDPPLVRLRLLDPTLIRGGFSDITVSLAELAQADPGAKTVFITENKINGLAFPPVKHSLVIFGLGYGVDMLPDIPWLGSKEMIYWGDIDTHGFAILSQLRGDFPNVRSMLMNRKTLLDHKALWGAEDSAKRYTGELPHLTSEEYDLFVDLKQDKLSTHLRLEQERVRFSAVREALKGYLL
ncbi:MAG: DUF2220 family protein [Desulfobacteraceae bacterium]|jgi:hypothetical protein